MSTINENAIKVKAAAFMKTSKGQALFSDMKKKYIKNGGKTQGGTVVHTPEEVVRRYKESLEVAIANAGFDGDTAQLLSDITYSSPKPLGNGTYTIEINFNGGSKGTLERPSLDPSSFDPVSNIVLLLNNGVDHIMKPVHGTWHGADYYSKTHIPPTHFIEQAEKEFLTKYANEYNVIGISSEILK